MKRFLLLVVLLTTGITTLIAAGSEQIPPDSMKWKIYEIKDLRDEREESKRDYLPFLRVPAMSAGLYELAAGAKDTQQPHKQDEIYYVLSGKAVIDVDGEKQPVKEGSVIYVKAGINHTFEKIEQNLSLLVVFAASSKE